MKAVVREDYYAVMMNFSKILGYELSISARSRLAVVVFLFLSTCCDSIESRTEYLNAIVDNKSHVPTPIVANRIQTIVLDGIVNTTASGIVNSSVEYIYQYTFNSSIFSKDHHVSNQSSTLIFIFSL